MSKLQKFQVTYGSAQSISPQGKPGIYPHLKLWWPVMCLAWGNFFFPKYQIQFPHKGKMWLILQWFHISHFSPATYPWGYVGSLPVVLELEKLQSPKRGWTLSWTSGMSHSAAPVWKWFLRKGSEMSHGIGDTQKYWQAEDQTKELLQTAKWGCREFGKWVGGGTKAIMGVPGG